MSDLKNCFRDHCVIGLNALGCSGCIEITTKKAPESCRDLANHNFYHPHGVVFLVKRRKTARPKLSSNVLCYRLSFSHPKNLGPIANQSFPLFVFPQPVCVDCGLMIN